MVICQQALRRTRLIAGAAGGLAFVIGALGLAGWIFDNRLLKTGLTEEVSMKPNTGVELCLAAGTLLYLLPNRRTLRRIRFAKLASFLVVLIAAATFSEHLIGWNLGIDELLFSEAGGEAATTSPGRMGPPACTSFVLLGIALFLFDETTPGGRAPAQWFALATCPIAILPLLGYVTEARQLYGIARYTGIALHTALALLLLAVGIFLARAEREPAAVFVANNPGGQVARTMLPAAVLLPILVGWLCTLGQKHGLYDAVFGRALLLLMMIGLFTAIVWRLSRRLSMVARERTAAEQASTQARAVAERLAAENDATLSVLESLLAHAPIGLVFFDRAGNCVRVNDFFADTLASADRRRIGRRLHEILPGIPAGLDVSIERAFADGTSTMNVELVSAPGTEQERSWLTGIFPVRDARGKIMLSGAVLIEITERKRLEAQKAALLDSERAARIEAERAATLKDQFLATLSHELRTPLNAILGWASIARQSPARPAELERSLETIERNARIQAQLIEDLLDVSRIVSGNMRLAVEAVQLPAVVQAAVSAVMPATEAKQIRLDFDFEAELVPIRGDAARLQQVVWNLLSNAVKFTPMGGRVWVGLHRRDSSVELSVSDDGIGISSEFLPHVFDRFRQGDSSTTRRHGGLGLGLSIVKQLVELHGGSVHVASPGDKQGATFTVSLPLCTQHEEESKAESARGLLPDVALSGVRVLVVDDESDAREFVGRVLASSKASVSLVGSVDEALAALERDEAHIVISDIGMPGKDGYDLIRAVRQHYDAKTIPAIAVTAFAQAEDRMRALSAGFQIHIPKPVDPHELTLAVASLAGRTGV